MEKSLSVFHKIFYCALEVCLVKNLKRQVPQAVHVVQWQSCKTERHHRPSFWRSAIPENGLFHLRITQNTKTLRYVSIQAYSPWVKGKTVPVLQTLCCQWGGALVRIKTQSHIRHQLTGAGICELIISMLAIETLTFAPPHPLTLMIDGWQHCPAEPQIFVTHHWALICCHMAILCAICVHVHNFCNHTLVHTSIASEVLKSFF